MSGEQCIGSSEPHLLLLGCTVIGDAQDIDSGKSSGLLWMQDQAGSGYRMQDQAGSGYRMQDSTEGFNEAFAGKARGCVHIDYS